MLNLFLHEILSMFFIMIMLISFYIIGNIMILLILFMFLLALSDLCIIKLVFFMRDFFFEVITWITIKYFY